MTNDKLQVEEPQAQPASSVRDELFCPECSYSLRQLSSAQCPECGLALAFIDGPESCIPWGNRQRIGGVWAYLKTVMQACFWPKRLCHEMCRRVDERDAGRFRLVSISICMLMLLGAAGLHYYGRPQDFRDARHYFGEWFLPTIAVSIFLTLLLMSGAAGDLFVTKLVHPELSRRAIALSAYSSAWLWWTWLPVALVAIGSQLKTRNGYAEGIVLITGLALGPGILFCWWASLMRVARYTVRDARLVRRVAWATPLVWGLAALVIGVGIPVAGLFISVVAYSLTT